MHIKSKYKQYERNVKWKGKLEWSSFKDQSKSLRGNYQDAEIEMIKNQGYQTREMRAIQQIWNPKQR